MRTAVPRIRGASQHETARHDWLDVEITVPCVLDTLITEKSSALLAWDGENQIGADWPAVPTLGRGCMRNGVGTLTVDTN